MKQERYNKFTCLVVASLIMAIGIMTLGAWPAEAAPFAYVTNLRSSTVSVIDTASNT